MDHVGSGGFTDAILAVSTVEGHIGLQGLRVPANEQGVVIVDGKTIVMMMVTSTLPRWGIIQQAQVSTVRLIWLATYTNG